MNFLGKNSSFPFRADVRGTFAVAATDDAVIEQSIVDLLETRQGERKMLPHYGLPDYLFDALDASFVPRVAFFIEEQILNYVTAIDTVSAVAETIEHRAVVRIVWTKRNSSVPQELIYPTWRLMPQ